jgi:hypothetical protein
MEQKEHGDNDGRQSQTVPKQEPFLEGSILSQTDPTFDTFLDFEVTPNDPITCQILLIKKHLRVHMRAKTWNTSEP